MNTWITSDLHFGHRRILEFHPNRAALGSTIEEHDEALVQYWRDLVAPGDVVYVLGDLTLDSRPEPTAQLLNRLPGQIKVAAGNHDTWIKRVSKAGLMPQHVEIIVDHKSMKRVRIDGKSVIVSHYPIEDWPGRKARPGRDGEDWRDGRWHLHGHSHGRSIFIPGRLDVGWDVHDKFLSWEDVRRIIGEQDA